MASLNGTTPAATYQSLIKFSDNGAISAILRALSDGAGGAIPMQVSSTQINFTGDILAKSNNLKYEFSSGNFGVGLGGFAPPARLSSVGAGLTGATINFKSQNSNASAYIQFTDAGIFNWIAAGGGGLLDANGISTYSFRALSGNGSAKLDLTGICRLSSPDGTQALDIGNASSSFTDALAIGQTAAPNAVSILDLVSTTKGLLFPRMTTAQKTAIAAVAGLVVYDTTTNKLCCYNGAIWNDLF